MFPIIPEDLFTDIKTFATDMDSIGTSKGLQIGTALATE
jgi:hypothetical protein